jgi:uncharacterized damage-inducible protein DinB
MLSTYTRQQMIWNLIRHDYHHYGELALTLRFSARIMSPCAVVRSSIALINRNT